MNRIEYYNTVYDKFWQRQTHRYGCTGYEEIIINNIVSRNAKKVFSCGIGTGWPIESELHKKGIIVDGCDVAEKSVKLAQKNLSNPAGIYTGIIQDCKSRKEYDVVYCMRASWLIPQFKDVITKMMDMCKENGTIIFDIMPIGKYDNFKEIVKQIFLKWVGVEKSDVPEFCYYSACKMARLLRANDFKVKVIKEEDIFQQKNRFNSHKLILIADKKGEKA